MDRLSTPERAGGIKQTTPDIRFWLFLGAVLVIAQGVILFLLPTRTEDLFAWTIAVPLTAAFFGAGYLASSVMDFLSSRERDWAMARLAVPSVLVFSILILLSTLLHLDKFHFNAPRWYTAAATWLWVIVYTAVPVGMAWSLIRQLRQPGGDPPRLAPMAGWFRVVLGFQSAVLLVLGIGCFLALPGAMSLWPWELTPLTSRVVGSWLIGMSVASGHMALENDWARILPTSISYALFGLLQLITLSRFPDAAGLDWSSPRAWVYAVFLISMALAGAFGAWMSRQHSPKRAAVPAAAD